MMMMNGHYAARRRFSWHLAATILIISPEQHAA
jgi:hypothetical protein